MDFVCTHNVRDTEINTKITVFETMYMYVLNMVYYTSMPIAPRRGGEQKAKENQVF